jgi:hypothetical protein
MMSNKLLKGEEILTDADYAKAGRTIAEPIAVKKTSNSGLTVALWAFNIAFLVVDTLSAFVVGYITYWYYGVATLLAGAMFMFVHEYLFTRAFNSARQRNIAIGGAVWAALTILGIALFSVVANLVGFTNQEWEGAFLATMVGIIVFNIVLHGVLTAVYYYIDDGHNASSKAARAKARAITQTAIDDAAEILLTKALERRINRKNLVHRYRNPQSVRMALEEAGGEVDEDLDEDGIPDRDDPIDNRTNRPFKRVYAKNTPAVQNVPTSFTIQDMEEISGMTVEEIRSRFHDYPEFSKWLSTEFEFISGGNMKRLWKEINPT